MRPLTCDSTFNDRDVEYRCWRRATSCSGTHFAVKQNVDKDITTKAEVVVWRTWRA